MATPCSTEALKRPRGDDARPFPGPPGPAASGCSAASPGGQACCVLPAELGHGAWRQHWDLHPWGPDQALTHRHTDSQSNTLTFQLTPTSAHGEITQWCFHLHGLINNILFNILYLFDISYQSHLIISDISYHMTCDINRMASHINHHMTLILLWHQSSRHRSWN